MTEICNYHVIEINTSEQKWQSLCDCLILLPRAQGTPQIQGEWSQTSMANTVGNVVRSDRTVMLMKSLRNLPYFSYGTNEQWQQLCE